MKKLNHVLNVITASLFGYFVAKLIFSYIDYKRMPDIYAMHPAPWYYYEVLPTFFVFATVVVISVLVKGVIFILERRKHK